MLHQMDAACESQSGRDLGSAAAQFLHRHRREFVLHLQGERHVGLASGRGNGNNKVILGDDQRGWTPMMLA